MIVDVGNSVVICSVVHQGIIINADNVVEVGAVIPGDLLHALIRGVVDELVNLRVD